MGWLLFIIKKGDLFFGSFSNNFDWGSIIFETKQGYIKNIKNKLYFNSYFNEFIFGKEFIIFNKKGSKLCKDISNNSQCEEFIDIIKYLDEIEVVKPYYRDTGIWFKVKYKGKEGYINKGNVIPKALYNYKQVEDFRNNFIKVCSSKEKNNEYSYNICYSTKKFLNGDAGENWYEKVYFSLNEFSGIFRYGRKYIETAGIIFKIEELSKKKYKVFYLDYYNYDINSFIVEFDFSNNKIYTPLPETLLKGSDYQDSNEILELKK